MEELKMAKGLKSVNAALPNHFQFSIPSFSISPCLAGNKNGVPHQDAVFKTLKLTGLLRQRTHLEGQAALQA